MSIAERQLERFSSLLNKFNVGKQKVCKLDALAGGASFSDRLAKQAGQCS